MNRRAFLIGTVFSLGLPAVARSGTVLPDVGGLRGRLPEPDPQLVAGAVDDQSLALQRAIDRAAAAGRPLFLPPGRYEVSNIRLPDRTRLVGVPGETQLVYTGGGSLLHAEGCRTLSLEGLTLDGANRALDDDEDGLVSLTFVDDLSLSRLDILGSAGHGLTLARVAGRVDNCRLSGARAAGLVSTDGRGVDITGNRISDCAGGGILVRRWQAADDRTAVSGNRIERIGGAGVRLMAAANVRIAGNDCRSIGGPAIIADAAASGTAVSGNSIDGAALGIGLFGGGDDRLALVDGNVVRGITDSNDFAGGDGRSGGVGIHVETDGSVTGNIVEGAPRLGLRLGWGATLGSVVASGNVVRDAGTGIGVSVLAPATATVITGNLLVHIANGAVRGMRWAEFATDDLTVAGAAALPGLTVGNNRVA